MSQTLNPDNLSQFRVKILEDIGSILGNELIRIVSDLLPFPGNNVKIFAPRFVELDDTGHRWGLVFGLTIDMELGGQGFKIALQRIAISLNGIEMDSEIRLGLKTPMSFGPVALSQIIVIYHTGADGGSKGLALGADLTALEPTLAHVLKIEAILDLRDVDRLRFELGGRLVAFGTVALLETSGLVDLAGQEAAFEATTTDAINDIIKVAADGRIVGRRENLFIARSEMALLGVDMSRTEVRFCTRTCDPLFPDGGSARLSVGQRFLFGDGTLDASTDLEFSDPALAAGVKLDLFGWKPGSASFSANTDRTRIELSFLGIDVGITTPTVELMTPGLIADVLKSLLDIDLSNLLKLPDKIEISLMKGDGSVQVVNSVGHDNNDGGGSGQSPGARPPVAEGRQPAPRGGAPVVPPGADGEPPAEEMATGPAQPYWGTRVTSIFCEEVEGRNGLTIDDGDRFQLWGEVFEPASSAVSPILGDIHPHEPPGWHTPTLSSKAAREICSRSNGGRTWEIGPIFANVGVARIPIGGFEGCEDHVPDFRYFRLDPGKESHKPRFTNAQRSVLCYEVDGARYDIEARLLLKLTPDGNRHVAVIYCPTVKRAEHKTALAAMPGWEHACGDNAEGSFDLGASGEEATIISDRTELKLIDEQLRGRLIAGSEGEFSREVKGGSFAFGDVEAKFKQVEILDASGAVTAIRFEIELPTQEEGVSRVEFLRLVKPAGDPTKSLWPWVQPDQHNGIRAALLHMWLKEGRQPYVIGSWPAEGWLVLRLGRHDKREVQLWLKDQVNDPPSARKFDVPHSPPSSWSEFRGPQHEMWLNGLKSLMPNFGAPQEWTLTLGVARQSGLVVYTFWSGIPADMSDAFNGSLVLHFNRLTTELKPEDSVWTGATKELGRSWCGPAGGILESMRKLAEPLLAGNLSLQGAFEDPDAMSEAAGLSAHVLDIIFRTPGACP